MKAIINNEQILTAVAEKMNKQVSYIQDGMDEDIICFTDGTQAYCFVRLNVAKSTTAEITFLNDNWEVEDTIKITIK